MSIGDRQVIQISETGHLHIVTLRNTSLLSRDELAPSFLKIQGILSLICIFPN